MKKPVQKSAFDVDGAFEEWREHWKEMPEYNSGHVAPIASIIVHFEKVEDIQELSRLLDQKITIKTKSFWFPKYSKEKPSNFIYENES